MYYLVNIGKRRCGNKVWKTFCNAFDCIPVAAVLYIYDISQSEKPRLLTFFQNNKKGSIRSIHLDTNRNYLFTCSFDDGEINVFDLDKPGREKYAKMNATLKGKDKVRAITWSAKRA